MGPAVLATALCAVFVQPCASGVQPDSTMKKHATLSRAPFGKLPGGRAVELFTLLNPSGLELR